MNYLSGKPSGSEYFKGTLDELNCPGNPTVLLKEWLGDFKTKSELDLSIVLSTVNKNGKPSSRVVLIKDVDEKGLYFYSNYNSKKGRDLLANPYAAAVFFWPELERQVRIEGEAEKISLYKSDKYFDTRPLDSKINSIISPQSENIPNRKFLLDRQSKFIEENRGKSMIKRPDYWGGYLIKPSSMEFWQGRPGRLNDRILYQIEESVWVMSRLAP